MACASNSPGDYHYVSTNGNTWTARTTPNNWYKVKYGGSVWVSSDFSQTSLYYSTNDGVSWSNANSPNRVWLSLFYGDGLWLAAATEPDVLYSSTDGINWYKTNSQSLEWRFVLYGDDLWVASSNDDRMFYSEDGINWEFGSDVDNACTHIEYGEGLYIASDNGATTNLYYSLDGIDWIKITAPVGNFAYFTYGNGKWLAVGSSQLYLALSSVVYIESNNVTLNGFIIDGDSITQKGIAGDNPTGFTGKFLELKNILVELISTFNAPSLSNNIAYESKYGIADVTSPFITECILYDIDNEALSISGSTLDISLCTFHNCGIGILVNDNITTTTAFKGHIFNACSYAVYSKASSLTLIDSVVNGSLFNCTIDEDSYVNVKVLFHDLANRDLHLRHKEEGYPIESTGVLLVGILSVSRDAGAYDVKFTTNSINWEEIYLDPQRFNVKRELVPVRSETAFTFTSSFHKYVQDFVWKFTITAQQAATTLSVYQFRALGEYLDLIPFFPVNTGITATGKSGSFVWENKSSIDGLIRCVVGSSDLSSVLSFFGTESPLGWFVRVDNISGATSPYIQYPFKIIGWEKSSGTLLLENYYDHYPNNGFVSNPDGTYTFNIIKALFVGVVKVVGANNDTKIIRLEATDLHQEWVTDQWKGTSVLLDCTPFGGSITYFYIAGNNSNTLYISNRNNTFFGGLNNIFHPIIDLIVCRSDPQNIEPGQLGNAEFGKHGNDWYTTKVNRGESADYQSTSQLAYNDTEQRITLIQTTDSDEDIK